MWPDTTEDPERCAELAVQLCFLSNKSLALEELPDDWKTAAVTALF